MYCLPDEVRDMLRPGTATTVSSGADDLSDVYLLTFISQAESRVNAMLAARYAVPFDDAAVPTVVHGITRDLAAAYTDRATKGQLPYSSQYDPILMLKADADTMLANLASGKAELGQPPTDGGPDPHASDAGRAGNVINPYDGALFSRRAPRERESIGGDSLNLRGVDWEEHWWPGW